MSTDDVETAGVSDTEGRVTKETEVSDDNVSKKRPKGVVIDERLLTLRTLVDKVITRFVPMKDYIEKTGRRFNERPLGEYC